MTGAPQALVDRLRTYEGTFTSPFRENLLFGKLSYQPRQAHQLQVTYNFRHETDIRGFGGQGGANSFETAENVRNRVDSVQGKYQIAGATGLNETYVSYQRYRWNPTAENYETVGENFSGLLRIGGRDTNQRMVQARTSLRHDHTRFLRWRGTHTAKVGGVASFADYDIRKELNGNPLFTYVNGISWNFPARAAYGVGDPDLSGTNWQFGIFAQDDWADHAAAHGQPRPPVGLRDRHDQHGLRHAGDRAHRDRAVRRRQPLLHRRRRSLTVLRRSPAAPRLLVRPARRRPLGRVRRVRPLLRSRPLRLDAGRARPPAVRDTHVPVLRERRHSRRRARRSSGTRRT